MYLQIKNALGLFCKTNKKDERNTLLIPVFLELIIYVEIVY